MAKQKISNIIVHLSSWLLFFIMPLVFMNSQFENSNFLEILVLPSYWIFCLSFLFLFYFINQFLIPNFYFRKRYTSYFSFLLVLFIAIYFLKPFNGLMEKNQHQPGRRMEMKHLEPFGGHLEFKPEHLPPPKRDGGHQSIWFFDIVSIFLFIMVVAITMATKINRRLYLTEKTALKSEADKAEAELSFLKAQINPHFLFNTLNNIYTLAVTSSNKTAESIMRLSNIMRYVTDEVENDWVALEDEINCVSDYILLQKLRLGDKTPVDFEVIGNIKNVTIAPLLIMTFVENAFKYGVSKQTDSPIVVKLEIINKKIKLLVENQIYSNNSKLTRKGIGIDNTKRRLAHLYPNKHHLEIVIHNGKFIVNLILDQHEQN